MESGISALLQNIALKWSSLSNWPKEAKMQNFPCDNDEV